MAGPAGGPPGEGGGISSCYIPATESTAGAGRHVLKNANSFAVLDTLGQIQASGAAAEGLFFEDTRYLSHLSVTINGARPLLLSSTVTQGNTTLSVDLANPEPTAHLPSNIPPSSIHLLNEITLGRDALFATVDVRNYGREYARLELTIALDAD